MDPLAREIKKAEVIGNLNMGLAFAGAVATVGSYSFDKPLLFTISSLATIGLGVRSIWHFVQASELKRTGITSPTPSKP
ncbi:MAG: hypothetical protein J0L77_06635 [Alphaproteobacteria bacterium]|nr:hypothetical protein [Alphaproteobacteria bacterium]